MSVEENCIQPVYGKSSPIVDIWEYVQRYNLLPLLYKVISGEILDYKNAKSNIKNIIKQHDYYEWFATRMLNDKLLLYTEIVPSVKMHTWWTVTQKLPHIFKHVSCVMAIIMGGQPSGMQRNFNSRTCQLCFCNNRDDLFHILFRCNELETPRIRLLSKLSNAMPFAMATEFNNMNVNDKTMFILSPLKSLYVAEWNNIYVAIAIFVKEIYAARAKLYDNLEMV